VSEIVDFSKDDPDITVICFDCTDKETKMEQTNYDPETNTHRFECPECDNIILIQKEIIMEKNEIERIETLSRTIHLLSDSESLKAISEIRTIARKYRERGEEGE
jgi:Zn finger protein HypA/HybF involved in hydrogenase expression